MKTMNVEERVLTALRCEQPDRVPVFLYLDPYDADAWYASEPSYRQVLEACKDLADVVFDWNFPYGSFLSAADLSTETLQRADGVREEVLHTPRGPISRLRRKNWGGLGRCQTLDYQYRRCTPRAFHPLQATAPGPCAFS